MKACGVLREAWRNILSGTTRAILLGVVLSIVVGGLVAAELWSVHALTTAADAFRRSGASIVTLSAAGRVDGAACAGLAELPGVRAAGAIRQVPEGLAVRALPSSTVPLFEVTPGVVDVLRADGGGRAGITLSRDVAETLGASSGDAIVTGGAAGGQPIIVARTYAWPDDGRKPGYGYAALVDVPSDGLFDECWVDAWPTGAQTAQLLRMTLTPGGDDAVEAKLSQLNTTLGVSFDGAEHFGQRLSRWGGIVGLLAGIGVGIISVRIRRLAHAAALHLGVTRADLARITAIETLSWLIPVVVIGAALTAVGARFAAANDQWVIAALGMSIVALSLAGAALGVAGALLATHERHFFRYFQER